MACLHSKGERKQAKAGLFGPAKTKSPQRSTAGFFVIERSDRTQMQSMTTSLTLPLAVPLPPLVTVQVSTAG